MDQSETLLLFFCWNQSETILLQGFPELLISVLYMGRRALGRDCTCVVWSWRLIDCFALESGVRVFWDTGFPRSLTQRFRYAGGPQWGRNSCLWLPLPAWYGCAHAWGTGPAVGWCMFAPCFKFAIELSSIYFSSITVFYDISKQNQQRTRIGKIFARWHLAIAITSIFISLFLF